jgi:hypothetical protein
VTVKISLGIRILVWRTQSEGPRAEYRHRWEDIIKTSIKEVSVRMLTEFM